MARSALQIALDDEEEKKREEERRARAAAVVENAVEPETVGRGLSELMASRREVDAGEAGLASDQALIDSAMKESDWRGSGLLGLPLAMIINKATEKGRREKYDDKFSGTAQRRLEAAADVEFRKNQEQDRRTLFEQAVEDASGLEATREQRVFNRGDEDEQRRYDFDLAKYNTDQEADAAKNVLLEQREYDEAQKAADRVYTEGRTQEKRDVAELAGVDEGTKILLDRAAEINNAMPSLRRMAGKGDEGSWNALERGFTGTGGLMQYIPSLRDDTQIVEGLASSEALAELGTMSVPLTPVSDTDIRTLMKTGISPGKNEKVNLDTAVKELADIERELKARAAKSRRLRGQYPAGVKSVKEI